MADLDVAIAGAGPAAMALAAACRARGADAATVGPDRPWSATYGAWVDELDASLSPALAHRSPIEVVAADPAGGGFERQVLGREYAVFDNGRLRAALRGPEHIDAEVIGVVHGADISVLETSAGRLGARVVIDATGAAPALVAPRGRRVTRDEVALQTAYGLVLDHRPEVIGGAGSVLMDWRQPSVVGATGRVPTFLYVLALGAGRWLVEETSLARRPAVGQDELRARLAARLGGDLTHRAEHVERVAIPMAPGVPPRGQRVVGFGAAAGYVHPATGYSVTASLRAAPRLAEAIVANLGAPAEVRSLRCWNAVWPAAHRRSRALHDYGLAALLRMPADELAVFFGAFFALPVERWSAYLRIDVEPSTVAAAMREVFSRLPWQLRARLAAGSPRPFARVLR